jgi:mannose-6-phosphate isomerase class I
MALDIRATVENALDKGGGILSLEPAWVARDFLPPGRRLGLKESEYEVGERGYICERWLASVTKADNRVGPTDEGLSYLALEAGERVSLKEAVEGAPGAIMGAEYAKTHKGLGRLAKIYDFNARIPYHIHQMEKDARKLGHNSKEEAYYFPEGVDLGPHPETYFGVHPYIVDQKKYDILLPYLKDWDSDLILRLSRAYLNVPGDGFHLPAGILHAPGTALTIELQEDSDVFAMLQALNAGKVISKELLYKDVTREDREKLGERAILEQLDWEANGDPYFYENHHTGARLIEASRQEGGEEYWIYYNTTKFSGKKLVVKPGKRYRSKDKGVYNILVWKGKGRYDGHPIEAGNFQCDELLVSHDRAVEPLEVENTGTEELLIIKFFGPDINLDIPYIERYKPPGR